MQIFSWILLSIPLIIFVIFLIKRNNKWKKILNWTLLLFWLIPTLLFFISWISCALLEKKILFDCREGISFGIISLFYSTVHYGILWSISQMVYNFSNKNKGDSIEGEKKKFSIKRLIIFGFVGAIVGLIIIILINLAIYAMLQIWSSGWGYPDYSFTDYWKEELPIGISFFREFSYLFVLAGLIFGLIFEKIGRIISNKKILPK